MAQVQKLRQRLGGQIQELFDDLCDAIGFTWFCDCGGKSWSVWMSI
jgi:hypothetical protein